MENISYDSLEYFHKNRFYSMVSLPNKIGCMNWISPVENSYFSNDEFSTTKPHHYAYRMYYGWLPKIMLDYITRNNLVKHSCGNNKCVAPKHLYIGHKKIISGVDIYNTVGNLSPREVLGLEHHPKNIMEAKEGYSIRLYTDDLGILRGEYVKENANG